MTALRRPSDSTRARLKALAADAAADPPTAKALALFLERDPEAALLTSTVYQAARAAPVSRIQAIEDRADEGGFDREAWEADDDG